MRCIRDAMDNFWSLLSVNSDLEGMEFISTLEAKEFPFYATQVKIQMFAFTVLYYT